MADDELKEYIYPAGVIKADIKKQASGKHWLQTVRYYYKDTEFICRDCGKKEVWTVAQQKLWYEEWGGNPEAVAVRCRDCRLKSKNEIPNNNMERTS